MLIVQAQDSADAATLLALLEQRAPRPLSIPEIARLLNLEHYNHKAMRAALEAGVMERNLRRIGKTRYQWIRDVERVSRTETKRARKTGRSAARTIEGRYTRVRAGFGFVEVLGRQADQFARDILIPASMEGAALHGDRVAVEIVRRDARVRRVVGRIVSVLERAHEQIIGTLELHGRHWRIVPDNDLLPPVDLIGDVQLDRDNHGLTARARLTRAATPTRPVGGELVEVLGAADDPEVQFLSIAYEHGLRTEFPPEVVAEATRLPPDPSASDFTGRDDLRALPFVTIDGETARDFDDAICLEARRSGYHLWVAIADVSHYVQPGSALDDEAGRRGTSVYFPNRAIPMLPPQLSSELCSLNPQRDRLVLVAELSYDRDAHRTDERFYRAVISSRARLTYTKVAAVLSTTDTAEIRASRNELGPLLSQLHRMHELMLKLYRNRIRGGSLDLDLPEALIDLSEQGRSIGVRLFHRNDAHRIVEEFMLEANCAVAAHLRDQRIPLPYRIHEPPDPDDIDELNQFLGPFGLAVEYRGGPEPSDVQRLLTRLQGHPLARVLTRQVLRALTQAQYSTRNAGHFGLAFPVYCHFTSPIRRYPDLLVHRQLGHLFDLASDRARADAEALEAAAVHSSQREREAMEAERAMLDLKKAEFMLDHLLEQEAGTIVSVTNFGFFVELDAYPIEGLVRLGDLTDDRYTFIERERALKGMRKGHRFRLGDRVLVEAINVDLRRREIDLALLERLATRVATTATDSPRRGKRSPNRARKRRA
ncbi:MAG TPA: ribonuclease R [Candidatus Binatia bacterium]|nr:ribonuclease R [Candidatus Binatia bacterium]